VALLEKRTDETNQPIERALLHVSKAPELHGPEQHQRIRAGNGARDVLFGVLDFATPGSLHPTVELALAKAELQPFELETLDGFVPRSRELALENLRDGRERRMAGRHPGNDDSSHPLALSKSQATSATALAARVAPARRQNERDALSATQDLPRF
jgi:hypothetical protein